MTFQDTPQDTHISPNRHEALEQLRSVPDTLRRLASERSVEAMQQPGSDGSVAMVEILCLMQDWEEITGERIVRILRENTPLLTSFDDSLWTIEHDYAARNGHEVIDAFTISREATLQALAEIDDVAWQRTAELPGEGIITLAWLVEQQLAADSARIERLVEAGH